LTQKCVEKGYMLVPRMGCNATVRCICHLMAFDAMRTGHATYLTFLYCERDGYSNNLKATGRLPLMIEIAKVRPGRPTQVDECPAARVATRQESH